jgi:DNA-binding MarR family transcriptional regulator
MALAGAEKTENSPLTESPAGALRVAVLRIYRALRIRTNHHVTPSQGSALARIEQAESVRLGQLALLEGISAASMSKIVDSLEDDGFVTRVPDPLDGRASMIQLSAVGRDMIHTIRVANTEALEVALTTLSDDERRLLRESLPVLEKVAASLQLREVG